MYSVNPSMLAGAAIALINEAKDRNGLVKLLGDAGRRAGKIENSRKQNRTTGRVKTFAVGKDILVTHGAAFNKKRGWLDSDHSTPGVARSFRPIIHAKSSFLSAAGSPARLFI